MNMDKSKIRGCLVKKKYFDIKTAERAIELIKIRNVNHGQSLHVYECHLCSCYHVGNESPRFKQKIKELIPDTPYTDNLMFLGAMGVR